jgi:hypothetical protein
LDADGKAKRLLSTLLASVLAEAEFRTGDDEADRLLRVATLGIRSPRLDSRRDALEKLWDAFERIKTLEPGKDKKEQVQALLNHAPGGPKFREMLDTEAKALTSIGNTFGIRHSETQQELLTAAAQIDALFHRMFAFLRLVLIATGRGS